MPKRSPSAKCGLPTEKTVRCNDCNKTFTLRARGLARAGGAKCLVCGCMLEVVPAATKWERNPLWFMRESPPVLSRQESRERNKPAGKHRKKRKKRNRPAKSATPELARRHEDAKAAAENDLNTYRARMRHPLP